MIQKRSVQKLIVFVLLILISMVVLLTIAVYLAIGNPFDPFDNARFSSAKWKTSSAVVRARMSRDLITNHIKIGDSKTLIINLLGQEMQSSPLSSPNGYQIEYHLGSWSYYQGMDDAFVCVAFDQNDRVTGATIFGY